MQFSLPQFIDVEDKIVGPFSLKQLIYLIVAGGILFGIYSFVPLSVFIIIAVPVIAIFGALAFLKINGRPISELVLAGFGYIRNPRERVWRRSINMNIIEERVRLEMNAEETQRQRAEDVEMARKFPRDKSSVTKRIDRLATLLDTTTDERASGKLAALEKEIYQIYGGEVEKPKNEMTRQEKEKNIRQYLGH